MIRSFIATAVSLSVAFCALAQINNDWEDTKSEGSQIENGVRVPVIFFRSSARNRGGAWSLMFLFTQDAETGRLGELELRLTYLHRNREWGICSLGKTGVLEAKRGNVYTYEREKTLVVVENPYQDTVFSIEQPLNFLRWLKEPLYSGASASSIKMRLTDGCGEKYDMEFRVDGEPFETFKEFKQFR